MFVYYPAKDRIQYFRYHVTERKLFYLQLLQETLTEREAKEKAQAETNHIVKSLSQLVMDKVISKSEVIRISGMSAYRFMKIARSMNP